MIPYLIETFLTAIGAGVFAGVYYKVIREEAPQAVQQFFANHEDAWFYKPLWGCIICISLHAGWIWYALFHLVFGVPALGWAALTVLHVLCGALSICLSMFTGMLVTRVILWLNKTTVNFK